MDDRGASLTGCRPSGGFSGFQQRYRSFPNALGQQGQDTHVKMIAASLSQPRAPTRLSTIRTTKDRANPLQPAVRDAMLAAVPSLRAFAISLCGKVDRADDLVQETLLRAPAEMARRAPPRGADDETIGEPEVARLSALPRVPSLTFALLARQLHQIPRFVDEEKVAGIVKILSLEVCCPELQLDLVVAHQTAVHHASAQVQRDFSRWPEGQYHGLGRLGHRAWLDHHSGTRQLPRVFGKYGNA